MCEAFKMNVKFLNRPYFPDSKEMDRREKLQEEFFLIHAELSYSLRDCQGYELWLRREIFRNNLRQRAIKLVKDKDLT